MIVELRCRNLLHILSFTTLGSSKMCGFSSGRSLIFLKSVISPSLAFALIAAGSTASKNLPLDCDRNSFLVANLSFGFASLRSSCLCFSRSFFWCRLSGMFPARTLAQHSQIQRISTGVAISKACKRFFDSLVSRLRNSLREEL